MTNKLVGYNDLIKIENGLSQNILKNVRKALNKAFENKKVELVGTDFDKNLYFYVDGLLKSTRWSMNENTLTFADITDIDVDVTTFKNEFENIVIEAINKLSNEELNEADETFDRAFNLQIREISKQKLACFSRPKKLMKENKKPKHTVIAKMKKVIKEEKISTLVESLRSLIYKFIGKPIGSDKKIEVNIVENKIQVIDMPQRAVSAIRKIQAAKQAARTLDLKPMFTEAKKFIGEHTELYLLNSKEVKVMLENIAKDDIAITKDNIEEAFNMFVSSREADTEIRSTIKEAFGEEDINNEPLEGQDNEKKTEIDNDIDQMDGKYNDEKMGFMKMFVEILTKLFEKIKELTKDTAIKARAERSLETMQEVSAEGKEWDKDKLQDIAAEAIELAASVEGIQPKEQDVAEKQVERAEDETETEEGQEDIRVGKPAMEGLEGDDEKDLLLDMPEEGGEEEGGEEFTDDIGASPDDMTSEEGVELSDLHCYSCDKEFAVETGCEEIHCPYCGVEVSADFDSEELPEEVPGQEGVEGTEGVEEEGYPAIQPQAVKKEVAILNVQPQEGSKKKGKKINEGIVQNIVSMLQDGGYHIDNMNALNKAVQNMNPQTYSTLIRAVHRSDEDAVIEIIDSAIKGSGMQLKTRKEDQLPIKKEIAIGNIQPQTESTDKGLQADIKSAHTTPSQTGQALQDKKIETPNSETQINPEKGKTGGSEKSKVVGGKSLETDIKSSNKTASKVGQALKDKKVKPEETEKQINPEGKTGAYEKSKTVGNDKLSDKKDDKNKIPSKTGEALKDTDDKAPKTEKKINEEEGKIPVKIEITDADFAGKDDEMDIYEKEPIEGEEVPVEEPVAEVPVEEPVAEEGGDIVSIIKSQVIDAIKDQITADEIRKYTTDHLDHYEQDTGNPIEGKEELINSIVDAVLADLDEVMEAGEEVPTEEVPVDDIGETPEHEAEETPAEEEEEHASGEEKIEPEDKIEIK